MKNQNLDQLRQVTEALYQSEQRKLAKLNAEENAIEASLSALALVERPATLERTAELNTMHVTGAELAWSTWSVRQRLQLNSRLAQLKVQKAQQSAQVRAAFGRREAIRLISDETPRK